MGSSLTPLLSLFGLRLSTQRSTGLELVICSHSERVSVLRCSRFTTVSRSKGPPPNKSRRRILPTTTPMLQLPDRPSI
jgi:hypothetical protein